MEQAMHAARLVAAHSALSALLDEQLPDTQADSITVTFNRDPDMGTSMDVCYCRRGAPVGGEGI